MAVVMDARATAEYDGSIKTLKYLKVIHPPARTNATMKRPIAAEVIAETRGKAKASNSPNARMINSSRARA
jgi:hypothetical protein